MTLQVHMFPISLLLTDRKWHFSQPWKFVTWSWAWK